MPEKTLLIVDDDPDARQLFTRILAKHYIIHTADSVDQAIKILSTNPVDIVLTDLVMPQKDGIALIQILQDDFNAIPAVVISGNATFSKVVEAMQKGAIDFIEKPIDSEILLVKIQKALEFADTKIEIKRLKNLYIPDLDLTGIIAKSPEIENVLLRLQKIASVDTSVLITGETGVGKDLFASLIMKNSERKNKKYVAVNCGSIPETLLESMLFGHKKGAFTSAYRDSIGYFEEANGGTIFLDEISETSLSFQIKLLRVLENKTIRKVGDSLDIPINVRILSATNKDLKTEIADGRFREDLYYRLNVIEVYIPPLRERLADIEVLSLHFMKEFADKLKKPLRKIDRPTMDTLLKQYWKGNVRELRNVIEHAVVMATHDTLLPDDLPQYLSSDSGSTSTSGSESVEYQGLDYTQAKEHFERNFFEHLLTLTRGDVFKAARLCNMTRQNLHKKINKYHIDADNYRS